MVEQEPKSRWSVYQWAIVLMLLAALVISAIDRVNISITGSYWVKHHEMSSGQLGLIQSIFSWSLTLFLLVAGPIIDRVHPRRALPIGMVIWTVATWLSAVTLRIPVLSVFRALLGFGESALLPAAPKVVVETVLPKDRTKAISVYFTGNKLGPTIGLPLAAALLVALGWRSVFYVTGAFSLAWTLVWLLIYRRARASVAAKEPSGARTANVSWGQLFAYRSTWAMIVGQFGYLYVLYVFLTWMPGILVLQHHLSIGASGSLSALPFIVSIVTTILGGWLADAWVNHGGSRTVVRKTIIGGGLLLSTIFVTIAAYSSSTATVMWFLVLTMASMGLVTGSVNSLPMDLAGPEIVSSVSSLQNFGGNLGASFAPLITGMLYGSLHSFRVPLIITGGVALVGAAAYVFLLGRVEHTYQVKDHPAALAEPVTVE
ncbi:MFS transporter [Alicyclobacillus cycloheptanicus]|uniref:MFS family permease n=1 Tax=Alicyclobacillus cycloheptanicus TaxID=1457 RepID=A0ABT9XFL5_9BACL|nr:MFS transporter [Alicyclobacillus cycloheptanicus]MDQ0189060.1 MFS family permease [Alicyclobacillus cycloheptanicus]WDM00196.1 MFS transporter [Alicyclobacillus cycloheptanicus]